MFRYVIFIMICLLIGSCGKKGPVTPLEKSEYPRPYPKLTKSDPESLQKSNKALLS